MYQIKEFTLKYLIWFIHLKIVKYMEKIVYNVKSPYVARRYIGAFKIEEALADN